MATSNGSMSQEFDQNGQRDLKEIHPRLSSHAQMQGMKKLRENESTEELLNDQNGMRRPPQAHQMLAAITAIGSQPDQGIDGASLANQDMLGIGHGGRSFLGLKKFQKDFPPFSLRVQENGLLGSRFFNDDHLVSTHVTSTRPYASTHASFSLNGVAVQTGSYHIYGILLF